jgi:hypothetical protein
MGKTHVIDGVTYVEVERIAKPGEKIISLKDDSLSDKWDFWIGSIHVVTDVEKSCGQYCVGINDNRGFYSTKEYRVLEPLEPEEVTVDGTQASEQVIEMFTALSRKIVSLERQLADTQRNVETWAEETQGVKHHAYAIERDVMELEKTTEVINAIKLYYAEGR